VELPDVWKGLEEKLDVGVHRFAHVVYSALSFT
jgi:hypothetical protein